MPSTIFLQDGVMGRFVGGSAGAMAREVAEGYVIVTERTLKHFNPGELQQLKFEIEKLLTALRAEQNPTDEPMVIQKRNRKISRLNGCLRLIQHQMQKRRLRP